MNKVKLAVTAYLGVVGVLSVSAADAETLDPELAPQAKIEACLAEVDQSADYTGSKKVRHLIGSQLNRRGTYKLKISTQIFDEGNGALIREYASVCYARTGDQPVLNITRKRS